MSETAKLTNKKFMVVLIDLFFSTTKQTSELPSRLIPTMTEQKTCITRCTGMLTQSYNDGLRLTSLAWPDVAVVKQTFLA